MSTGDDGADRLVDDLFREVDDQFADLEREYNQAREELATADTERRDTSSDALVASNERFGLMSQVATLEAEVSRQRDELDERDRMLTELGDKIAGFEADIAKRDELLAELKAAKADAAEQRREQARLAALLDARAAERQELVEVAQRLQNERDNVQELLTTALARFDEAEKSMAQMDDKIRHIEAARDTAAREHDARAHELIESRAEMGKLSDQLAELARTTAAAEDRAQKADALAERRNNEAGYLNRRIETMAEKLAEAEGVQDEAKELQRELTVAERRIVELERDLDAAQAEASASAAAVDAIANRTADYDELVATVARLESERDAAWEAASGYGSANPPAPADDADDDEPDDVSALADRARELGGRRAGEAELAANAVEEAAADAGAAGVDAGATDEDAESAGSDDELAELDADDIDLIESDLADVDPEAAPPVAGAGTDRDVVVEFDGTESLPRIDLDAAAPPPSPPTEAVTAGAASEDPAVDTSEIPAVAIEEEAAADSESGADADADAAATADDGEPGPEVIPLITLDHLDDDDDIDEDAAVSTPEPPPARKRTILPADMEPNTPEAVAHLLNQPGVTAIVDARSTCGRTGIRPSELFERVEALRDHFDVPVEVVVTPVSTPVGGAPDLPAIGVHHVTGADTVADRIRALCMGLPIDQPLVVIAGDDHVRRAAIGEEANVVEPSAVMSIVAG